jgi:hypothetical protein
MAGEAMRILCIARCRNVVDQASLCKMSDQGFVYRRDIGNLLMTTSFRCSYIESAHRFARVANSTPDV